jgi:hypothetical protein
MKIFVRSFILLLLLIVSFQACKKDNENEYEEVILDIPYTIQPDSNDFMVFYIFDSVTLNMMMGGGLDQITTLELMEAKFKVTAYDGPSEQKLSAKFYVSEAYGAGIKELCSINDQNLSSLLTDEIILTIQNDAAVLFAELIKSTPHEVQLTFQGQTIPTPGVGFNGSVIFKFKQHKDNPT